MLAARLLPRILHPNSPALQPQPCLGLQVADEEVCTDLESRRGLGV